MNVRVSLAPSFDLADFNPSTKAIYDRSLFRPSKQQLVCKWQHDAERRLICSWYTLDREAGSQRSRPTYSFGFEIPENASRTQKGESQ
jgi:hypothetical protein